MVEGDKSIRIVGARQNNLRNVSIDIPRNKIVVFTGVSGSGKSSLVFETINAEAQRQLYSMFSTFVQGKLPRISKPDVDLVENVSPAIVVKQHRSSNMGGTRSTVGTTSEIYTYLRLLYSRIGKPTIGSSNHFSFNSTEGMCTFCNGTGQTRQLELHKIIDQERSLNDGAILFSDFNVGSLYWKFYGSSKLFDADLPLKNYSKQLFQKLLYGRPEKVTIGDAQSGIDVTFEGVITKIKRLYVHQDFSTMSDRKRKTIEKYLSVQACKECGGARLNQTALSVTVNGCGIDEVSHFEINELITFINGIEDPQADTILSQIRTRSQHLAEIGLNYLSLSRQLDTLSGGELQRVRLANQLGSTLTEMLYILDEPSIGLHPHDVGRLTTLLHKLRERGNSVLVVEHDGDIIGIADHVVDIGPKAGVNGGEIVFQGNFENLLRSDSPTGKHLRSSGKIKRNCRRSKGFFEIRNARSNNLKGFDVDIPKGVFVCVTGVAGSGKSSLIGGEFLRLNPDAIVVDQSSIGRSIRSNPLTYTGAFDDIRKAFAGANGVSAKQFSFNSSGACPLCRGLGFVETEMAFLDPVRTICEECDGKRYSAETLSYRYEGYSIADILKLSVDQAVGVFHEDSILRKLRVLQQVGLGYLIVGQPLSSLSGGECQRVKLTSELHKTGKAYVLDEPTTGLHISDVSKIVEIIDDLTDKGSSVIVIEHSLDLIVQADWIIDIGPGGGCDGGRVVFEGTPGRMYEESTTITAHYLRKYLSKGKKAAVH